MTDFDIINHGSIAQFVPNTLEAEAWLREHVEAEAWQRLGRTVCVEPRFAMPIMEGITSAGLTQAYNGREVTVTCN